MCCHGLPESILTDHGMEFNNQYLAMVEQQMSIDKKRISAFHPQSNGTEERVNQTVGSLIQYSSLYQYRNVLGQKSGENIGKSPWEHGQMRE